MENSKDEFEYTFSVFTPTYNRADTLERAYQSLREQTFSDFEWVIVDDDSDDDTTDRVTTWQEEADFPIRFSVQDRPGKHIAFNEGVKLARGRYFLPLDSDDTCHPNTLQRFADLWTDEVPDDMHIRGVNALCVDQHGDIVGDKFPRDGIVADYFDLRYKYDVQGDGMNTFRTAILRRYPFPEIEGVRYIPESYIWSQIDADGYESYCVNEVLGTYYTDEDTRGDQLTQSINGHDAPAFELWHRHRLNHHLNWFVVEPLPFLTTAAGYSKHSFINGKSLREQFNGLNSGFARTLWLLCLPIGYLAARFV